MPPDARRSLGAAGEVLAADRYVERGYQVLDRNWRCREGELDLVLAGPGVVVFCEVKTRRSDAFGAPVEAITPAKQRTLRTLALRWLADHPTHRGRDLRFDVASVMAPWGRVASVEILEGAF